MHLDIQQFIDDNLETKPSKVAVALSGGPDSMFLCIKLHEWAKDQSIDVIAIIVDHKLRPESTTEANTVSDFIHSYGIKSQILTWAHGDIKSNIQAKARSARYKLLTDYCKDNGINNLFLGHTLDDQAETIMMRIFRGTGIEGLKGIAAKSQKHGVTVLRPLLHTRKHQILDALAKNHISFVTDPSNNNEKFDRIKIRKILAMIYELYHESQAEDIFHRFNLLASNCSRSLSYILKRVDSVIVRHVSYNKKYNFALINTKVLKMHSEVKLRLFQQILTKVSKTKAPIRLKSLLNLIENISPNKIMTLAGCEIHLRKEGIIVFQETPKSKSIFIKGGMHHGLITEDALKQLKAAGHKIPTLPLKKILLVQPAVYNADGRLVEGLGRKL
ncbi:MAG: tRNA lysidine(34) synthetase TilS [Alphaproteobacteria bacterium]|jgi:tRNA(Ile)-lysidine synthase|nr:tRNA lysidine(34) synthetase TilS [Candidatus Jidaibacter sp.]